MARDLSGSPERALWLAVITQAVLDAQGVNESRNSSLSDRRLADEASAFLVSDTAHWRGARAEVCANAGIDPDWLRAQAAAGPIITCARSVDAVMAHYTPDGDDAGPIIPGGGAAILGGVVAI